MANYDALEAFLARRGGEELELGFADLERIIGGELPLGALRPQWWTNENGPGVPQMHCRSWRNPGYDAYLLNGERVMFRRRR